MRFDIITLFPEMFGGVFGASIIRRAVNRGAIDIRLHQLRDYASDRHRTVDDAPFGGGAGMVLKAEPLFNAWDAIKSDGSSAEKVYTVVTAPQGAQFDQVWAENMQQQAQVIIVCGHYEGIDERFIQHAADAVISAGPYVLTGGELAAMVMVDAVARLVPDVLGNADSARYDTFSAANARQSAPPVYTRPADYQGMKVPEVLLSGDHARIKAWRSQQSAARSQNVRLPRDKNAG